MRHTIKGWLKAGVVDKYVFTPTRAGTPQGGVISPLLANIALSGMEKEAIGGKRRPNREQPILVRYADDYVILHSEKDVLEQAAKRVTDGLRNMGLAINPEKTRVTHTLNPYEGNVGFDFLGFTVRQFPVGKTHTGKDTRGRPLGFKTIIKPSKEAVKTHIGSINQKMKELRTAAQDTLIGALNPIIRGWCNYNSKVVSSKVFTGCDHIQFYQLLSWMKRRHPKKSVSWMHNKYWHREDDKRWVFATPVKSQQGEEYLLKLKRHSNTHIQRHVKIRGVASPYDGKLIYWAQRLNDHPLMKQEEAKLLQQQKGMCPRCGLYFKDGDRLEIDHVLPTAMGGRDTLGNKMVYHRHCHDQKTAEDLIHIRKFKAAQASITSDHTLRSRVRG
jgi:RNA-directed DNA polymerase